MALARCAGFGPEGTMVAYASRVTEDAVKRPIRFENGGFFPPMLTSSNYHSLQKAFGSPVEKVGYRVRMPFLFIPGAGEILGKNQKFGKGGKKMRRIGVFLLTGLFLLIGAFLLNGGTSAATTVPSKEKTLKTIREINVPFIKNKGQVDRRVAFYAQTFGGTVFITKEGELVYSLPKFKGKKIAGGVALRESLKGAKVRKVLGLRKSETRINYFIGKDRKRWKTNLETFKEVSLGEVYKGIELRLRAYGDNVEKVFEVRAGADPERIVLRLEGVKGLRVDERTGELIAETELGEVKFTRPLAYQEVDGRKIEVEARYRLLSRNTYGFEVGRYDRGRPLVIDPLLASTYLGGENSDNAFSIVLDSSGNVYVAGETDSTDFPIKNGYKTNYGGGHKDVFVSKLSPDLSTLIASTYLGGSGDDKTYPSFSTIALDANGNVYVAGNTDSENFPVTDSAYQKDYGGGINDVFIAKLSSDLSQLLASTYLGGSENDVEQSIALDSEGNVYITGWSGGHFPVTDNAYQKDHGGGNSDAFIAKLNSDLSQLLASTYLGGSEGEEGTSIKIYSGNVYVAGNTDSDDFPTTGGVYNRTHTGVGDVFIAKLSSDLSQLLASTYLGGSENDYSVSMAIDTNGNIYVAGGTGSNDFPTTNGSLADTYLGDEDGFISKLSSDLSQLLSSTYFGGSEDDDVIYSIAIYSGNIYITGITESDNFPTTNGAYDETYNGRKDGFISKLSPDLSTLIASTYFGGSSTDWPESIATDSNGNVYVVGYTSSINFPTTNGAYDTNRQGWSDAFIFKLSNDLSAASSEYTLTLNVSGPGSGTVTSDPAGINCPGSCSATFKDGTEVTLTATPNNGSSFTGWTGDCAGCGNNTECTITMDSDKTCTAGFEGPSQPKTGDVTGDGNIDIIDALAVARYVVGLQVNSFHPEAADVNCDGKLDIIDALSIARKALGLPVGGWCGGSPRP